MKYLAEEKDGGGVALSVYVQPRASKNRVAGEHDNALKLCITAPPVEGKANKAVISLLARLFSIPKTAVSIKSGQRGRSKRVILKQITLDQARRKLTEILS